MRSRKWPKRYAVGVSIDDSGENVPVFWDGDLMRPNGHSFGERWKSDGSGFGLDAVRGWLTGGGLGRSKLGTYLIFQDYYT